MLLKFREATSKEDLGICHRIISKAGIDMYERLGFMHWYPPKPFEKFLENNKEKKIFLCYVDEKPAATFSLSEIDIGYCEPIWENTENTFIISKLAVYPSFQNMGIGTHCLKFIETYAKKHNKSRLLLDALGKHKGLEIFYKNFGFNVIVERTIKNKRGITWEIKQFEKEL